MATSRVDRLPAIPACMIAPALAGAQVTAIKAGRLVDPESGTVATDQVIVVEGATVKAVGPALAIPAGAEVIDLSKATILPGLFDCHTHLCTNMGHPAGEGLREFHEALLVTTVSNTTGYRALVGAANARAMLEAGVDDVAALKKVQFVMKDGRIIRR